MCLDEDKQQEFITKCIDAHYSDVYDTKSIPMSAVVDAKISVTDNAEEDSKEEKVVGNADSKDEKVIGANTEEETTILRDRSNFHDGDNKVYHSTKKRYQNSVIAYIGNSKVGYSMTVYGHFRCDEEARDACAKLSNIHDITFYVIYTGRCVQIPAPYMPEITHQTDKSVEPVLNKMKMKIPNIRKLTRDEFLAYQRQVVEAGGRELFDKIMSDQGFTPKVNIGDTVTERTFRQDHE